MKKVFFVLIFVCFITACGGAKSPELQRLEAKGKILSLNTELNELKIEFEKERIANESLKANVQQINKKADEKTSDFAESDMGISSVRDAKQAQKALKRAEKANRSLAKSNKKMQKIERKIQKIQFKIDGLNKKVKFVDN